MDKESVPYQHGRRKYAVQMDVFRAVATALADAPNGLRFDQVMQLTGVTRTQAMRALPVVGYSWREEGRLSQVKTREFQGKTWRLSVDWEALVAVYMMDHPEKVTPYRKAPVNEIAPTFYSQDPNDYVTDSLGRLMPRRTA